MRNEEIRAEFLISLIKHSLVFWKSNVPTIAKINWKIHGQTSKHTKEAEATRPTTKFPAMRKVGRKNAFNRFLFMNCLTG